MILSFVYRVLAMHFHKTLHSERSLGIFVLCIEHVSSTT